MIDGTLRWWLKDRELGLSTSRSTSPANTPNFPAKPPICTIAHAPRMRPCLQLMHLHAWMVVRCARGGALPGRMRPGSSRPAGPYGRGFPAEPGREEVFWWGLVFGEDAIRPMPPCGITKRGTRPACDGAWEPGVLSATGWPAQAALRWGPVCGHLAAGLSARGAAQRI